MSLVARDQAVIWHPYTQHKVSPLPVPIVQASGAYLTDEKGKRYLDLTSSWLVNLHGHCQPDIAKAIYEQAMTMEHVIFAGFTHEPAVSLAEKLLSLLPAKFSRIFYSDNGSTSVEVALKMAYQYWRNKGEEKRRRFIAFDHAYHGDTFGAMAVGKKCGFYAPFEDLLFSVDTFPFPATWIGDPEAEDKEQQVLTQMARHLEKFGAETAALIIEPLVQGSGGMHMCTPRFLQQMEKLLQAHDVLTIYDEVMTGFGRTGDYFACLKSQTTPDIICLSKGITGGFLPLAVTACHERLYEAFLGDTVAKALLHGHSYTANPLGCAAALVSLELLKKSHAARAMIENTHQQAMTRLMQTTAIEKPRYCGTISAFNVKLGGYGSAASRELQKRFVEQGLLLRLLGDAIYFLPPYCVTEAELISAYDVVLHAIEGVTA